MSAVNTNSASAADGGKVRVKKAMLGKAVRALSQVVAKRSANSNPLFDSSTETMTVLFTLSRVPEKRKMKPFMIRLPHPMCDEKSEVCFISKDPQKKYKELLMEKHPVPGLTKVIGIDKLRRNYKTVEQKRALADAFDLFLCDRAIAEMMPKVLGSIFYQKKKKLPVPVKLKLDDPAPEIKKAIAGTALRVPSGPCLGVRFGRCSMTPEQLQDNATQVIATVIKYLSDNPVLTISVQATDAPALPVWRRPRPAGELVNLKKYKSDQMSSAASESGGAASETEGGSSEIRSDAGETLSTRDSASEIGSAVDSVSEFDDEGELDLSSDGQDSEDDAPPVPKDRLPLKMALNKKRKKQAEPPVAAAASMPPPAKKAKKGGSR